MLFGNKKIYIIFFFLIFILNQKLFAFENKIIIKINDSIITSLDVHNETNYLKALNKSIQKLDKNKIKEIATNSLVREKIKLVEISKYIDEIKIEKNYLNQLIETRYLRLGFNNKDDFLFNLETIDLKLNTIEKKLTIEALWNQIIYSKYSQKIKINKKEIKKSIEVSNKQKIKKYLLSEILFNVENNDELKIKLIKIKESIKKVGFENTAINFSISDSSSIGGKIGWIEENLLNKNIRDELNKIDVGDLSNAIITPGGFMILKIEDIKMVQKKEITNVEKKLKELVILETNKQLNQYSNIYFNKIKKDVQINKI